MTNLSRQVGSTPRHAAPARRWNPYRLWSYGFPGLLLLASVSAAPPSPPASPPVPPPAARPGAAAPAADAASPMDEPLRLIAEARRSYDKIHDYTCTMVKKERMDGKMTPDNVIVLSVRTEPFSVDLRWTEPKALIGQEACYVTGANDGKMRARSAGLLGAVGFISLDPNDARAQSTSHHAITEAGIGNLIERFAGRWEAERRLNLTKVKVAEYEYNKRRCVRVETIHPGNADGQFLSYRTVLYFDKETHLPIRVEAYDWPRADGDPGEVLEVYSYVNLRLNVNLSDDVFDH